MTRRRTQREDALRFLRYAVPRMTSEMLAALVDPTITDERLRALKATFREGWPELVSWAEYVGRK